MPGAQSTKHSEIVKANGQTVILVAVAAFVSVFCLISSYALWKQNIYQRHVIGAKEKAYTQLKTNVAAANSLMQSYSDFTTTEQNVIGRSATGTGDSEGDNAKIILDALPSSYDFPALATSLEKILQDRSLTNASIGGSDDELAQQANMASPAPVAVPMSFTLGVTGTSYQSVQDLISVFQRSVRPIQIDSIDMNGSNSSMSVNISAHTYYQPPKNLSITKQVVK